MGRKRCIYKKPNDRKEYVKYKGKLVTLKEFKESLKKVKVKQCHKYIPVNKSLIKIINMYSFLFN